MLEFLRRLGKALLATLAGAIVVPLFIIAHKISIIPFALLRLIKNLYRYAREAYHTGLYSRGFAKAIFDIAGTAVHISLHLIWNLGVVIPLYPIFLGWSIVLGISLGLVSGFQGLSGFCKSQIAQLVSNFTNATNVEVPSFIDSVYLIDIATRVQEHVQINTGVNLNGLELSPEDLATLRTNHQERELSSEEIAQLEQDQNQDIKTLVATYKNLHTRLEQDIYPILLERPEKKDTLLLVKYYQRNEQWLPVPNSSYIFDKLSLQGWLAGHSPHPNTRDPITHPAQHEGCPTRYKSYPYYASADSMSGNSEELSGMALRLRSHLTHQPTPVVNVIPPVVVHSKKAMIASRLATFGLLNTPTRSDEPVNGDAATASLR